VPVDIGAHHLTSLVCYSLGIYLLNLFLAFLQPKFDPSLAQDEGLEDGQSSLPTKQDEEFRPFIRRLPEFKFWHSATRAIAISFACTWFSVFNVPVFWPVLVVYFIILFSLTSNSSSAAHLPPDQRTSSSLAELTVLLVFSAKTNPTYDQIPLRAFHVWKSPVQSAKQHLKPALGSQKSAHMEKSGPHFGTLQGLDTDVEQAFLPSLLRCIYTGCGGARNRMLLSSSQAVRERR
jgi:hypothetical protein